MAEHKDSGQEKRICLAKVAQPHGVKGLVKLFIYAEDVSLFDGHPFFASETGGEPFTISLKSQSGKYWLASLSSIHSREDAEEWRGTEIWADRNILPDLEEDDEIYHEDLIGLTAQDDHGVSIGAVITVQNFGASDLLEIKPENGSSFYIPFAEEFISNINLDDNIITVLRAEEFKT